MLELERSGGRELADLTIWTSVITGQEHCESSPVQDPIGRSSRAASRTTVRLLVVDDEPINVQLVVAYLRDAGYRQIITFTDPVAALIAIEQEDFDAALLDIMMPRISGLDLLQQLRESVSRRYVPAIVLTASTQRTLKTRAIELGAADFLNKPFDPEELLARVDGALIRRAHFDHLQRYSSELEKQVQQRTAELVSSQMQLVQCLGRAAEYRDNETGRHIERVGRYSGLMASQLGLDPVYVRRIELAATLHDIGKIGLPDSILLKPDELENHEIGRMREHALLGQEIISPRRSHAIARAADDAGCRDQLLQTFDSPLMNLAASIAATHHEKWDGSGYPLGLQGEQIPLAGRIVSVADVFDALSSQRPYKSAFPFDGCVSILQNGRGSHFDPVVLDAFLERLDDVRRIQAQYGDRAE